MNAEEDLSREIVGIEATEVERIYFNSMQLRQCAIRKEWSPVEKQRLDSLQNASLKSAGFMTQQERVAQARGMLWNLFALVVSTRFRHGGEEDDHLQVTDSDLIHQFLEALREPREPHPTDHEMNKVDHLEIHFRPRFARRRAPLIYRFFAPYLAFCFGARFALVLQTLGRREAERMKSWVKTHYAEVRWIRIGRKEVNCQKEMAQILNALMETDERAFDFAHPYRRLDVALGCDFQHFLYIPLIFEPHHYGEVAETLPPLPPFLWDYINRTE